MTTDRKASPTLTWYCWRVWGVGEDGELDACIVRAQCASDKDAEKFIRRRVRELEKMINGKITKIRPDKSALIEANN